MKLAIFISGRGSNMLALLDYASRPNASITPVLVLADGPAPGLDDAGSRNIKTLPLPREDYAGRAEHEAAVIAAVEECGAEMIALAGYMRLLSADFCDRFKDRIINIHPSLLPRHKGLDTHRRAIEAGDERHGCSVHLVTTGMDEGPVIAQKTIAVRDEDTPETLAARVLKEEHRLYPLVLGALATGSVIIKDGEVIHKPDFIEKAAAGEDGLIWPSA